MESEDDIQMGKKGKGKGRIGPKMVEIEQSESESDGTEGIIRDNVSDSGSWKSWAQIWDIMRFVWGIALYNEARIGNCDIMKFYAEDCVTLYTQVVADSRAESQISSPSRFIDHSKNASIICLWKKTDTESIIYVFLLIV